MCTLTQDEKKIVETYVLKAMEQRGIFTGWDIYRSVIKENVFESPSSEVSVYVRELFNTGQISGYCSTCVDPSSPEGSNRPRGPVLYFPQPHHIVKRCGRIRIKIKQS